MRCIGRDKALAIWILGIRPGAVETFNNTCGAT